MTRASRRRLTQWTLCAVSLAMLAVFLFPVYWMVATSVKSTPDIFALPPKLVPIPLDLETWRVRILGDPRLLHYVYNSMIIATGTMVLTLCLSSPAAYALAKLEMRGKSLIMLVNLSSLMFPAIMLATPLFVIYSRLGLTNNYLGLILADTSLALPYGVVLLRPTFASIPSELAEAALIDGCGPFSAFWRVMLPVARSGLMTVAIFAFLWGWGDFVFALTLSSADQMRPVTTGLWGFFGANTTDWAGVMAFSTLAMLPPIALFMFSQRQVVSGLTTGAVKG